MVPTHFGLLFAALCLSEPFWNQVIAKTPPHGPWHTKYDVGWQSQAYRRNAKSRHCADRIRFTQSQLLYCHALQIQRDASTLTKKVIVTSDVQAVILDIQKVLLGIMSWFRGLVAFVGVASAAPGIPNIADDLVIGVDSRSAYRATCCVCALFFVILVI